MMVIFSTPDGGRVSINSAFVASIEERAGSEGCEVRLASGNVVPLAIGFGKVCAKLDPASAAPAASGRSKAR